MSHVTDELREGGGEKLPLTLLVAVEVEDADPDDDERRPYR